MPSHEQYPQAMLVPELSEDIEVRQEALRFIGACVLDHEMNPPDNEAHLTVQPIESLYDALGKAAEGSAEAYKMVETNVKTDVVERTMKTGHVSKVDLSINEAGKIQQFGHSLESVQANSLRYAADNPQMRERTEAEATNAFRLEKLYSTGALEDHSFVVFSRAADNMNQNEMEEAGFFTDTMSTSIQVTSAKGDRLVTESAFVSGVKKPGDRRHDAATVVGLADKLGVDLSGKSATEVLGTPLLVPNSLLKNGVIDLVKLYDEQAGGTFFGADKPKEDYIGYLEVCKQREERWQPKVDEVTRKLIELSGQIKDRVDAVKTLGKLSQDSMVVQAFGDLDIDPKVFGPAANHIEEGRIALMNGEAQKLHLAMISAVKTAVSDSCPSGLGNSVNGEPNEKNYLESESDEDCEFISKSCPMCGEKNVKTKVTKKRITGSCGCELAK